jgi:hypothetical protein
MIKFVMAEKRGGAPWRKRPLVDMQNGADEPGQHGRRGKVIVTPQVDGRKGSSRHMSLSVGIAAIEIITTQLRWCGTRLSGKAVADPGSQAG